MPSFLGLDIGTTTVTAVVVDAESGTVLAKATAPNDGEITSSEDKRLGRSEWNPGRILEVARSVLTDATQGIEVAAVGVTGQMHGTLLVDVSGQPVGPFIGWQDQRGNEAHPSGSGTIVSKLADEVGRADPAGDVIGPKTGYLAATLAWLRAHDALSVDLCATFLPDFIVSSLTDTQPVTDATNAAGSGVFDVRARAYNLDVLDAAGLEVSLFPKVVPSGIKAGCLADRWSDTGLDAGIPVSVACGDNQASFLGSVRDPEASVLINVGTGGQVSTSVGSPVSGPGLEARPHVDGRYILVGAGLVGGRTYAWLRDFFVEIGRQVFECEGDSELVYSRMTSLAAKTDTGGLVFEPLFTGTREEPDRRGILSGIGTSNASPGHLSRSLLEGMVAQFKQQYSHALSAGVLPRHTLVGAGNGIRKNPILREIAEVEFESEMLVPQHTEEAAYGAAMQAMVMGGGQESLSSAAKVIQYQPRSESKPRHPSGCRSLV